MISNSMSSKVKATAKVSLPPRTTQTHAAPAPLSHTIQQFGPTAGGDTGSHISDPIRADLGKLTPLLASGIRRVAGSK
jgi:hypothetical protein